MTLKICLLIFTLHLINLPYTCGNWDFAVASEGQLEFFDGNGNVTQIHNFKDPTALAFDPLEQHIFISDYDSKTNLTSIFSLDLMKGEAITTIAQNLGNNVKGLAYDTVSSTLFWTKESSIFTLELDKNDKAGQVILTFEEKEDPWGITVDICNRYLYWTNRNHKNASIERSRLDGSQREILVRDDLFHPVGLAVDQQKEKLIWCDDHEGIYYKIERSNLDGSFRETVVHSRHQQPIALTIGPELIYWTDWTNKAVWSIPRDSVVGIEPRMMPPFLDRGFPQGVVAWSKGKGAAGVACGAKSNGEPGTQDVSMMRPKNVLPKASSQWMASTENYCLNGGVFMENGRKKACSCPYGFAGPRCELSACHNFCIRGTCTSDENGYPKCVCLPGHRGQRCEWDICDGFCLNGGRCVVEGRGEPTCQCIDNYKGRRCDERKDMDHLCRIYCLYGQFYVPLEGGVTPMCICSHSSNLNQYEILSAENATGNEQFVSHDASSCETLQSCIIVGLGILCFGLILFNVFIMRKNCILRRRPRIKKRIIVNKNVTALTNRPLQSSDQCEITIENCCNMNVCETPCFEPQLRISKALTKGEERKNLLYSMEDGSSCSPHPEDLY